MLEKLAVAVEEHRVIKGELRIEVGVQRWLTQVDPVGQITQRDRGQTALAGQLPRLADDCRLPGLVPAPAAVDGRGVRRPRLSLTTTPIIDCFSIAHR